MVPTRRDPSASFSPHIWIVLQPVNGRARLRLATACQAAHEEYAAFAMPSILGKLDELAQCRAVADRRKRHRKAILRVRAGGLDSIKLNQRRPREAGITPDGKCTGDSLAHPIRVWLAEVVEQDR